MILLTNGRVLTRVGTEFYENGAVAIEGRYIKEVGDAAAMKAKYPAQPV
jgi:predicted amidohydrolase YtcJ